MARTNLKTHIDKVLANRSNVPSFAPLDKDAAEMSRLKDTQGPSARSATRSNSQALFSSNPLFSANANFSEDEPPLLAPVSKSTITTKEEGASLVDRPSVDKEEDNCKYSRHVNIFPLTHLKR